MRSKAPLALMEQLVMILVFSLAAALCLQVFVLADKTSRHHEDVDNAVLLAQNTAEVLKERGSVEAAQAAVGGTIRQTMWSTHYDETLRPVEDPAEAVYDVDVLPQRSGTEGLGEAHIEVFRHDGNTGLFSITAAWQEVG